jgi:multidrug efflux pump
MRPVVLARFFIDRPVLAWVISLVIVLLGLIAAALLPISEYPEITPPTVRVSATYPGANARVVADTVAGPIEQQVVGVENMLYMSSQSNNDGSYSLDVTFALGTDVDLAQVLVQNRVAIAEPQLPDVIRTTGVTVRKRSPDILLVVSLYSENDPETGRPRYDQLYLSNYAAINLRDVLARVEGVGEATIFGQQDYSMRVWLDPDKLASRGLAAGDVIRVLREQNVQVAAGQIGRSPVPLGQDFQYAVSTLGRLEEAEQFGDIVLKTGTGGQVTYLKDVSRIELGARSQDTRSRLDGRPSAGIGIFQLPGSNALDTADLVKARMRELESRFPTGVKYAIVYDTTPFIQESVDEVFVTLRDAVILVALVVLLFLQDWKSLLLPLIDVGVSLIGTFAVMSLLGFSLNNLTLFGLVLAIGIVVDDAIVVLENIERWLDQGLPVREATITAMSEITGPIVAITLVLSSVFIPSTFLGGITGQFFRQFALTISVSMIISAVNAMTMTPARAAWIYANRKPGPHGDHGKEALPWWSFALFGGLASVWLLAPLLGPWLGLPLAHGGAAAGGGLRASLLTWAAYLAFFLPGAVAGGVLGWFIIRPVNWTLARFFQGFNWIFDRATQVYGKTVGWCLRLSAIVLLVYVGLLGLTGFGFNGLPTGFVPSQDKGYLLVNIQLPDSASLERTLEVTEVVEKIALETPGVAHVIGIPGQSFVLGAVSSNYGSLFINLKSFDERKDPALSGEAIAAQLRRRFQAEIIEARVNVFGPAAVPGLGSSGGFKLIVQGTGDVNFDALQAQADNLAIRGNQQPGMVGLFNGFRARTPQVYVDVDRVKVKTLGVELTDVFDALQVYLGGYYVNDFNRFGRTWQVNLQADSAFRTDAEAVRQFKVRNAEGDMVPLGAVAEVQDYAGPIQITRYNMLPAAAINGASLPGVSTGDVLSTMEQLADRELPSDMTYEWTELSHLQKQSSRVESFRDLQQNPFSAFALGVVLVFFVLAGLYESWSLPLAVILVVPMCLLSAIAGIAVARMDINIYVQIGFVVLVGLACKNAILIVEFARDRQQEGASRFEAAVEAARVRLRPIIMTSLAFILGVFPLVIAQGAGAEMRRTLGTAVFYGMIGVTAFGIFLTPVFYYVVRWFSDPRPADPAPARAHASSDGIGRPSLPRPSVPVPTTGENHPPELKEQVAPSIGASSDSSNSPRQDELRQSSG